MIFGALQTLNEEACEDVLEEQEKGHVIATPNVLSTVTSGWYFSNFNKIYL